VGKAFLSGGGEPPAWDRVEVGEVGRTLSSLRPSGKAQFGDTIVDVLTEGDFVDHDQPIRVWQRQGVRVIVRKLE
jgi:membrane-bound serine protease (ClpP class)